VRFLSCNIGLDKIVPFVLKDISGTKVGIIGVTAISAGRKAVSLNFTEPKIAVKNAVEELKKKNAEIIILLSGLDESENLNLINQIPGIDIIISGHSRAEKEGATKAGAALMLYPAFQGRTLSQVRLTITNGRVAGYKTEDLRLSDKIKDDPGILTILPCCFSDSNCKREGFLGSCQDPGNANAHCRFTKPAKIGLTIIMPKKCRVCNPEPTVSYLKSRFPGLEISNLYYPSKEADKLFKESGAGALPVYLLSKEAEKEIGFDKQFKNVVEDKGSFYMVKPEYSGFSYLLGRDKIKGRLDLFISLYAKQARETLIAVSSSNPSVHFLAVEKDGTFNSARGRPEIEEYLRSVCVKKYYPDYFFEYISCRAKDIDSTWWQDCIGQMDNAKIISCARGDEGAGLLRQNIGLNKEARIVFGPTYLLDNIEVFATNGAPTKEEFRKILKELNSK
jgi:hypothetical protein